MKLSAMSYKTSTNIKGFTLIELMIVVVIIAILAAISYPSFQSFIERSRLENARSVMSDNIRFLEQHYGQHRSFCIGAVAADSTCVVTPTLKQDPDSRYTLRLESAKSSAYILVAEPMSGVYTANQLDNKMLNIVYSSISGTFSRCTKPGLNDSLSAKDGNPMRQENNCEVF